MDDFSQTILLSSTIASYESAFQGHLEPVGSILKSGLGHLFNVGIDPPPPGTARTISSNLQVDLRILYPFKTITYCSLHKHPYEY